VHRNETILFTMDNSKLFTAASGVEVKRFSEFDRRLVLNPAKY